MRYRATSTFQAPSIVNDWHSIDHLRTLFSPKEETCVLVEDAGDGFIAIGPIAASGMSGCIDCYIERRKANGAKQLLPCSDASHDSIAPHISHLVRRCTSDHVNRQILVSPSGQVSEHILLPMPGCPRCATQGPAATFLTLEAALDARLGIVSSVNTGIDPDTGYYFARAHGASYMTKHGDPVFNHGFAADKTPQAARVRALGEAVERYAGALAQPHLTTAPEDWALWPEARKSGADRIRWVAARRPDGTLGSVPARRISLPYRPELNEAPLDAPVSSTGMAAASSFDAARAKGFVEMIERDVFMRSWRGMTGVWPLPVEPDDPLGLVVVQIAHAGRLPVVAAFYESSTVPYTATGLAGGSTRAEARIAAVREAVAARIWVKERLSKAGPLPVGLPRTLYDHAVVHACDPTLRQARLRWLETRAPGQPYAHAEEAVFDASIDNVFCVDLTTPDVGSLRVSVARVISPDRVELECDATRPVLPGTTVPHPYA